MGCPRLRVECVTKAEAKDLATTAHTSGGHWGRDQVKLQLLDWIACPGLDQIVMAAISECGHCKNFGASYLHSLQNPITRRLPFQLLVGDYLSLPASKGSFYTIGLYFDICT